MLFLESLLREPLHSIEAIQICPKDTTFETFSDAQYHSIFRALDESFNAPSSEFAALKYFICYTEDSMGDIHEIVQAAFREMMPKSFERGILWWGDADAEDVVGEQTGSSRWRHLIDFHHSFSYFTAYRKECFIMPPPHDALCSIMSMHQRGFS